MSGRFLADTNVLMAILQDVRRLTREQRRAVETSERDGLPMCVSAMTLIEFASLLRIGSKRLKLDVEELAEKLGDAELVEIVPLSIAIMQDMAVIGHLLPDPADCAIVATARVHGLTLLTMDQRIIESRLARVLE